MTTLIFSALRGAKERYTPEVKKKKKNTYRYWKSETFKSPSLQIIRAHCFIFVWHNEILY